MIDSNGREVTLGDRVRVWANNYGTVVCDFDAGKYSAKYPREEWEYLAKGLFLELDSGALLHYEGSDEDFELIEA